MYEYYIPVFYMDAVTYMCLNPVSINMEMKYHENENNQIYIF